MATYPGFTEFETNIPKTQGYIASRQDPYQQNLYRSMFEGIGVNPAQELSRMAQGDDSYFAPMEQQALRQFRQRITPQIASQFVGRLGGSAAQGAFAQAGSNLAQDLFAQRAQMRQQSLRDLVNLEDTLLNKNTFERTVFKKPSTWDQLSPYLPGLASAVGGGIGFLAGGPGGAAAGASAGSSLASSILG